MRTICESNRRRRHGRRIRSLRQRGWRRRQLRDGPADRHRARRGPRDAVRAEGRLRTAQPARPSRRATSPTPASEGYRRASEAAGELGREGPRRCTTRRATPCRKGADEAQRYVRDATGATGSTVGWQHGAGAAPGTRLRLESTRGTGSIGCAGPARRPAGHAGRLAPELIVVTRRRRARSRTSCSPRPASAAAYVVVTTPPLRRLAFARRAAVAGRQRSGRTC